MHWPYANNDKTKESRRIRIFPQPLGGINRLSRRRRHYSGNHDDDVENESLKYLKNCTAKSLRLRDKPQSQLGRVGNSFFNFKTRLRLVQKLKKTRSPFLGVILLYFHRSSSPVIFRIINIAQLLLENLLSSDGNSQRCSCRWAS